MHTEPDHRSSADFRLFLQEELLRRCRRNPSYSVRAFASFLQCDHSALSKVLRGTRPLGKNTIRKWGERLGLDPVRIEEFSREARSRGAPKRRPGDPTGQGAGAASGPDYRQLTLDSFQIISDWYHYAILELMRLPSFEPDPAWIARALGIGRNEARIAVERLMRVEMIGIRKDGSWKDLSGGRSTTLGSLPTAGAFRNLQKQVLLKALDALEKVPVERRDQSSMTMAIRSARLPAAKERIRKFRRELVDLLALGEPPDEVYNLSVSLYPVTSLKHPEPARTPSKEKRR